jgi:hypothetical protein
MTVSFMVREIERRGAAVKRRMLARRRKKKPPHGAGAVLYVRRGANAAPPQRVAPEARSGAEGGSPRVPTIVLRLGIKSAALPVDGGGRRF